MGVVHVWAFRVKAGHEAAFARVYGPEGAWARFYRRSPEFLKVELLRDAADPRRFLTLDWFSAADAREALVAAHRAEYDALDAAWAEATEEETLLGVFEVAPT